MARKILVLGAGKSTSYLLDFFLDNSVSQDLHLTIGDLYPKSIAKDIANHPNCNVMTLNIMEKEPRSKAIQSADIVVSMLPVRLHTKVAQDCLQFKKHLVTASYVSDAIRKLDPEVRESNLVFMNEIGLDPGIDHITFLSIFLVLCFQL